MGYQFFLPMVLRWRASRAEAPLLALKHKKYKTKIRKEIMINHKGTRMAEDGSD